MTTTTAMTERPHSTVLPPNATSGQDRGRRAARPALLYAGCLLAAGAYGLTLLIPGFVKAAGGNAAQAGLIYWCGALGAGGALVFGGRLTERVGTCWAAVAGSGLYAIATAILACGGGRSGSAYAAGVLLGAGWATFFTAAPIVASSMPGRSSPSTRFQVLAGFNALGMGATPIAGQLLIGHGLPYRDVFAAAALLSLGSGALFCLLAAWLPARAGSARAGGRPPGVAGPFRQVLASKARPFLLMVLLGACVFSTMTTYQATFAASRGTSPAVFFACYTLGVIIPRFTLTRVLARRSPAAVTTALLAGMCLALAGFLLPGHEPVVYGGTSALLGLSYGLAYPLIQARAADSAPQGLRHWTLWYFSLAYFAGVYGFPVVAGTVIVLGGYQALIACLLVIAALELAISVRFRHAAAGGRPGPG
jgi:MFS family permease